MGISFGGLASGLDSNAIINAILAVESRPIQLLQARKSTEQQKISLYGTLEGLVKTLQEKAAALTSGSGFLAQSISASSEGVAQFSLTGAATDGAHSLTVTSLASADRHAFTGVADPDTDLGAGTISFTYDGTTYDAMVAADASSLTEIAAAINTAADGAVTASVVNTGTSASPSHRLVLAGEDTGADYQITGLTSSVSGLSGSTELSDASNAIVTVDGLTVERSTNVFDDVIAGVSFTVLEEGGTTNFSVEVDNEGTKENVRELVDAYNEVIEFINQQSRFDPESGPGGGLFGDAGLSTVRSSLYTAMFSVDIDEVMADTAGFSTLGLVGIDLQSDGTLKLDESKFDEKLAQDRDALADLFTGDEDGVLVRLDEAIDVLRFGPSDEEGAPIVVAGETIAGLFDRRTGTLETVIDRLDDEIERLERNLEKMEESLRQRFANLEQLVGGLNAQQAYLQSGLAFPS